MARATTTKMAARTPRGKAVARAPKRRPGRPLGSTNAKSGKTAARRSTAAKPVAREPKLSKAELEAQVAKLERSIARLREKNRELKQVATDAQDRADMIEARHASRPRAAGAAKPGRKPGRRATANASVAPDDLSAE